MSVFKSFKSKLYTSNQIIGTFLYVLDMRLSYFADFLQTFFIN